MSALDPRLKSAALCERDFLATLIRNPSEVPETRDSVPVEALPTDAGQRVYRAVLRLHDRRQLIDFAGVYGELAASGESADVGAEWLGDLTALGGSAATLPMHAARVLSLALSRDLRMATVETLGDLEKPDSPPEELLERAQQRLERLASRASGAESTPISDAMARMLDTLDKRSRGEMRSGLATGFELLDRQLCGGLPLDGLTVLAARPSVGKTALSVNIASHVARRGGSVLFVSLEQPEAELTERIAAMESQVNGSRLRTGQLDTADVANVADAASTASGWRMLINDVPGQTAAQVASAARLAKRKLRGLDLVVVDYLNLIRADNPKVTRNEQVGASATRLRVMARELNVPVLLLCQLNRGAADGDGVPRLHQLRDSGEIEQVADVVAFLHRALAWEPNRPDKIELHIAKQRNGPLGVVTFDHDSRVYTFREAPPIL